MHLFAAECAATSTSAAYWFLDIFIKRLCINIVCRVCTVCCATGMVTLTEDKEEEQDHTSTCVVNGQVLHAMLKQQKQQLSLTCMETGTKIQQERGLPRLYGLFLVSQ